MTLAEYGMWFQAFSDSMPCPPGDAFWRVICMRIEGIDGTPYVEDQHEIVTETDPVALLRYMTDLGRADAARLLIDSRV